MRPIMLHGMTLGLVLLGAVLPGSNAKAQATISTCDTKAIVWHFPDDFEGALEEARDRQRLLMIKGISFGVDRLGATCATKGKW